MLEERASTRRMSPRMSLESRKKVLYPHLFNAVSRREFSVEKRDSLVSENSSARPLPERYGTLESDTSINEGTGEPAYADALENRDHPSSQARPVGRSSGFTAQPC